MALQTHPRKQSKSMRRNAVGEIRRAVGSSSAGPPSVMEIQRAAESLNQLLRLTTDDRLQIAICEAPTTIGASTVRPLNREELMEVVADWHEEEQQRVRKRRGPPVNEPEAPKKSTTP